MRAMLVSFATYNLYLDWKKIAGHLARVFLDYEPGIHYPQLQMQAGTTGINAMRVYNVTKQGEDQDPNGVFTRKYVPELQNVPNEYIHEPCNMPVWLQRKCRVIIGNGEGKANKIRSMFQPIKQSATSEKESSKSNEAVRYPSPIVDEKASAKAAKDKLSAVRKQETTRAEAQQVYLKHGSRAKRMSDRDGAKPKALSSTVKRVKTDKGQTSLMNSWRSSSPEKPKAKTKIQRQEVIEIDLCPGQASGKAKTSGKSSSPMSKLLMQKEASNIMETKTAAWSCNACTYLNEKPLALACSICGSVRQ